MADEQTVQSDATPSTESAPSTEPQSPTGPTWDNVTQASPDPPPAPLETTEGQPAPEPAAQPTPEPAPAREGESEPITPSPKADDYAPEPDDPPEIAALTTPKAKAWAKRQFVEAKVVRDFLRPDHPIKSIGDDLYQRSPSRYWEHVDDIADTHADEIVKRLLGVPTLAEAKSKLQSQPAPVSTPSTTTQQPQQSTVTLTEAELNTLSDAQIVERFEAVKKSAQEEAEQRLRTEFEQKFNELKSQFDDVNGKFKTQEQTAREQQVAAKNRELYDKVWSVVEDGKRDLGLEPKADDPPKLVGLKQAAQHLLDQDNVERAFDESEDNIKLVKTVMEFNRRGEFHNAEREEDNLKVRARAAFEKAVQRPEVQTILSEIAAFVEQSKAKPKPTDPAPPVAGAAAGVTIKPPTTWDEAIAQSQSAA